MFPVGKADINKKQFLSDTEETMSDQNNKDEKWLPFDGEALKMGFGYVILQATDGSSAVIRVKANDFKLINGQPHLRLGTKIKIIDYPQTHPNIKELPCSHPTHR